MHALSDALDKQYPTAANAYHLKHIFNLVDRRYFVKPPAVAYIDRPQPIPGEQTISAPHIHWMTLTHMWDRLQEWKRLHPQASSTLPRILDIGCGSGYVVALACAALDYFRVQNPSYQWESSKIHVFGIEYLPSVVKYGQKCLETWASDCAPSCRYQIVRKNGWEGDATHKPYLFINVGAQMDSVPRELLQQLMKEGALLGPLQNDYILFTKGCTSNTYIKSYLTAVRFAPLIHPSADRLPTKRNTVNARRGRRRSRTRRRRLKVFQNERFRF